MKGLSRRMIRTGFIKELRAHVQGEKRKGKKIAIVPTMGYLHRGHLSLVEEAKRAGAFVVMSIFVNPLQFGPKEDFGRYPRDLERDSSLAEEAGVDLLFHPALEEMYPEPMLTLVEVKELDAVLCGKSRPGHFTGVATVVAKLFNIVQPDLAFFGQKDYQQVQVIRRMVSDLNMPVEVRSVPIARAEDGLALSSRNVYLSPQQRAEAVVLYQSLEEGAAAIRKGERSARALENLIRAKIKAESSGDIDYVEVRDAADLKEVTEIEGPVVIALAVKFGQTRLIDNKVVEVGTDV